MAAERGERFRRSGSSWLRLLLFNVIFVGLPLGIYFVFYVDARVEQTTVRNFRALDAAAKRLVEVIDNVPRIAENAPAPAIPDPAELVMQDADEAAQQKRHAAARGNTATQGNLIAINALYQAYIDDFAAAAGAPVFRVEPLALQPAEQVEHRLGGAEALLLSGLDADIRQSGDPSTQCTDSGVTRWLTRTQAGVELEVLDCRAFSTRAPRLAMALEGDAVRTVLDGYGVRVAMGLDSLVRNVAANVAPLFDQYLITDAQGQVLYLADSDAEGFRYDAVTGAPRGRRVRLDFVSQVDLRELVSSRGSRSEPALSSTLGALRTAEREAAAAENTSEWARYGIHSRLERLTVGDIGFSAFVHPFLIDGLVPLEHPEDPQADRSPVLYMIGIVNRDALSRESLRLRLSLVGEALLVIGALFASMSLIWLWTAGDRLVLGLRHLLVVFVTGLTSALLLTLLVLHVAARHADAAALDQALKLTSERIRGDFMNEIHDRIGDLATATATMLSAREAPARRWRDQVPSDGGVQGDADRVAENVERRFACRPDPRTAGDQGVEWPPDARIDRRFPRYDLAFLLDDNGRQWQCLSYRLFDTAPLDLAFRKYFQHPRDGRLWHAAGTPGFFIERVTSVLDGTTETVLAMQPEALCGGGEIDCGDLPDLSSVRSAVIIGRLHSLEETVLPPHLRFAVVENHSGATLFHSVRNRALATNFIKQTEGAPALLSHIDAGSEGLVDLDYHGTSIRAFAAPLDTALPWTLVTYRGHELEDTLGAITVSATATSLVGLWLLLGVTLTLAWLLVRQREVARHVPALRDIHVAFSGTMLVAGMVVLAVALWLPAAGAAAAVAVLLATVLVAAMVGWRSRNGAVSLQDAAAAVQRRALLSTLVFLIVLLAVLPAVGLFAYFRSEVSAGFGHYVRQAVAEDVGAKCQRHRGYARRYKGGYADIARAGVDDAAQWTGVFAYGWTLAAAPSSPADTGQPCAAFEGAGERYAAIHRALPQLETQRLPGLGVMEVSSSFSSLARDLVVRAGMVLPDRELDSPGEVMDLLLGAPDATFWSRLDLERWVVLVLLAALGFLLVRFFAASIVDRLFGCHVGIARLPEAPVARPPAAWRRRDKGPLRACVVHRSENLCSLLIEQLLEERFAKACRVRWTGTQLTWERIPDRQPQPSGDDEAASHPEDAAQAEDQPDSGETLHVVAGFERLVTDPAARPALLLELERLTSTGASLLVCSRILPGYWLAKLTEEAVGELAGVPADVGQSTRWSYVIGPLDVRRIRDRREQLIQRFDRELEQLEDGVEVPQALRRHLQKEGVENPELLNLAAAVARYAARNGSSVAEAMQRFTSGAAGHFHELWATSTYEERLQLYALARNGFANPTQGAVLSSLANRGLITSSGVVQLRSPAFGRFVANNLIHDALLAWRDEGHGNRWKSIWPPLVIIVVLALTFFVSSTPEALAPLAVLLAAGLGAVPVIGSVIRSVKELRQSSADG